MRLKQRAVRAAEGVCALALIGAIATVSAVAGTDATFGDTVGDLEDFASGSLGKLAGIAGLCTALVGMVLKFDWKLIGGAIGIGLTAATGPAIVTGLASATF
jgi:conjugal transfer pilus assembly protein TraA